MSETRIYEVDEGGARYTIVAADASAACRQWREYHRSTGENPDDYGEPEIVLIQLAAAARSMITLEDTEATTCGACSGRGVIHKNKQISAHAAWLNDAKLPPEKRARYGILACSEWP